VTGAGYAAHEGDAAAVVEDGIERRTVIDASCGCERLEAHTLRVAAGKRGERVTGERQELLFVAAGRGTLHLGGERHELAPDTGVYLQPGERWSVEADDDLRLVCVTAPAEHAGERTAVTVRYADREALPATPNREFRYLVNQDAGCLDVTQFVGLIPPGRAGMHSHTYDEIVYVVDGEGVLHVDGQEDRPLRPGTCIHLPPLREHSLENTGETPMRVLGVFHPSGDPASRATVAEA
jgi:mannose-6-phosphate isomerase-like protein (cupin superfamily)